MEDILAVVAGAIDSTVEVDKFADNRVAVVDIVVVVFDIVVVVVADNTVVGNIVDTVTVLDIVVGNSFP